MFLLALKPASLRKPSFVNSRFTYQPFSFEQLFPLFVVINFSLKLDLSFLRHFDSGVTMVTEFCRFLRLLHRFHFPSLSAERQGEADLNDEVRSGGLGHNPEGPVGEANFISVPLEEAERLVQEQSLPQIPFQVYGRLYEILRPLQFNLGAIMVLLGS